MARMQSCANNMMPGPSAMVMIPVMVPLSTPMPYMPIGFPTPLMAAVVPQSSPQVPYDNSGQPYTTHINQHKHENVELTSESRSQHQPIQKKGLVKLRNKKIVKELVMHSSADPIEPIERSDSIIATLVARRKEQLLRLALGALGNTSLFHLEELEDPDKALADILSETTATHSLCSAQLSIDEDSSSEATSLLERSVSQVLRTDIQPPRIGIDIGNVLLKAGKDVRGSCRALRAILKFFGVDNVFLVSKVRENSKMHVATKEWLHGPHGFLERTGLPSKNVRFVSEIDGPDGKGAAADMLGLSHFVDDRWEVLQAVFADKAGNSGDLVRRHRGTLFHFACGSKPTRPEMSSEMESHYCVVAGWSDVLESLGIPDSEAKSESVAIESQTTPIHTATRFAPVSMVVHEIDVGIEEDVHFGICKRLLGNNGENFKNISSSTGVKLLLQGKGSPQPQPQSLKNERLRVCIRAKPNDDLRGATESVEALINDLRKEYQSTNTRTRMRVFDRTRA